MPGKKALFPTAVLAMGCSERRLPQQTLLSSTSNLRDAPNSLDRDPSL